MPCVICPFGKCPPDCIYLRVFPYEEPFTEESILNAQKTFSMFKMEYIKNRLRECKEWGGLKLMKECVRGWVMEYDFRDIDRARAISLTHQVVRKIEALRRKKIDECTKRYGVPPLSKLKNVDPGLLKWYKERNGLLEDDFSSSAADSAAAADTDTDDDAADDDSYLLKWYKELNGRKRAECFPILYDSWEEPNLYD